MIELEEWWGDGYYIQGGKEVRLQAADFANAISLCKTLTPLKIDTILLFRLSFQSVNAATGTYQRFSEGGACFMIRPGMGGRWYIGEDKITERCVFYVHQLQRLFFSLYSEHLRFRGDEISAPNRLKISYKQSSQQKVEYVRVPSDDPKNKKGYMHIAVTEKIAQPDYYLTHDCTCLIRNLNWAIWTISHDKEPLFEYAGKRWGLIRVAGKTVTIEDTIKAGKWLKQHLIDNGAEV